MVHASEQQRDDVKAQRECWVEHQPNMDSEKLVFIDESGVNTDMTRRYGRAVGKARVHDHAPLNTPKGTTIVSSVRLDGTTAYENFQGSLTGEKFLNYVQNTLAPTLRKGDVVVMDNLRCHKVKGVKEAVEAVGATIIYLPPYSPDFNPIEMMWSKIKSLLRKWKARTLSELHSLIPDAFSQISTGDISGWFAACNYLRS